MKCLASLVLMLLFADSAYAGDKNGYFERLGAGTQSCGTMLYNIQNNSNYEAVYGAWLSGFLSDYNESTKNTYSILGHTDVMGAFQWTVQYCQQHPIESYASAAEALIAVLYPARLQSAP